MIYISFNDPVSGIYQSQVVDTLNCLNTFTSKPIKLIAFFSLRNFKTQRRLAKKAYSNTICLPLFPKLKYWRYNSIALTVLLFFLPRQSIICRGIFATGIALKGRFNKQKVCYDGRGAIYAECKEYDVLDGALQLAEVKKLESNAVLATDYQIAVTKQLVEYWKTELDYDHTSHTIIPCTLGDTFIKEQGSITRKSLSWDDDAVILAFSGSIAGWQSLSLLDDILRAYLDENKNVRILFMSKTHKIIDGLIADYPNRVQNKWVNHNEVYAYLNLCDYGILIREQTNTNKVASPVKFAEYLSAGLRVLLSENLGDYSEMVVKNNLGSIINAGSTKTVRATTSEEKARLIQYVHDHLTKKSLCIQEHYRQLTKELT
ncbi:MAG: hypothetical protein JKY42_10020 [Flavobacteriales bacterium]|nr:hypothetical protein [Flavobacteriales bacterium]